MLAQVTRAIYRRKVLEIKYLSLSSGYKARQIAPHALVDNGKRWHVRAFDRENNRFSDFVINRIQFAHALDEDIVDREGATLRFKRLERAFLWSCDLVVREIRALSNPEEVTAVRSISETSAQETTFWRLAMMTPST